MVTPDDQQLPLFELDPADTFQSAGDKAKTLPAAETSPFSKYIVYVDESGDHSLTQAIDQELPRIRAGLLCLPQASLQRVHIVPALEKFKFNHFGHDQVVLHENEIRKEKGAFNIFQGEERAAKCQFVGSTDGDHRAKQLQFNQLHHRQAAHSQIKA